jgi:hypothetical protein
MRRYSLAGLSLALVVLGGQACKKADQTAARADSAAAAAPAPPPPAPLAVSSVELGKAIGPDKRVTSPTTTFGVRDTIYASVSTTGAASNATLGAHWTFGPSNKLVDSTSVPIMPTGPAVTEFHVMRTSPWPVGKYKVAIYLNGQQTQEKEFEVKR